MGSIEKRTRADGSASYRVRVKYCGRVLRSTHRDHAKAKRWAAEKGAEIRDDAHFAGEANRNRRMAELLDRYDNTVVSKKRDARNQRRQVLWWKARIGHLSVGNVSRSLIAQCRDELEVLPVGAGRRRAPATVVRYLAVLSHVYTVACTDWEWAETNPVKGLRKPKEPRGRDRYLSGVERDRLLSACKQSASPNLYAFVLTALCTGMRRGEIATLEWADIDFQSAQINIRNSKNGMRRGVPLCSPALEVLQTRAAVRDHDSPLVFPGADPNRPADLKTPWETAVRRAALKDFRFHDLRHSAASHLAMSGASLLDIAAILGHKTLQMTQRYSHLSVDHLRAAMSRANEGVRDHA